MREPFAAQKAVVRNNARQPVSGTYIFEMVRGPDSRAAVFSHTEAVLAAAY